MEWRITNRNDRNTYVKAEVINFEDITYAGFFNFDTFQPNGLGALYISGQCSKCGYWNQGDFVDRLSEDEYNKRMNQLLNQ